MSSNLKWHNTYEQILYFQGLNFMQPWSALQVKSKRRMHDVGFKLYHCYTVWKMRFWFSQAVSRLTCMEFLSARNHFTHSQWMSHDTSEKVAHCTVQCSAVCITKLKNLAVCLLKEHITLVRARTIVLVVAEQLRHHVSRTKWVD